MKPETDSTFLQSGRSESQIPYVDALKTYHRNSDWWAVFAAFDLPDFVPSPLWISKRTGFLVEDVVEALEGLATLGYLRKESGAFYPVKGKTFVQFDITGRSKAEVLEEHSLISQQILNDLDPTARAAIDHRCIAADLSIIKELYSDISKAFQKAFESSQTSKTNDGIFKLTFTAVDILDGQSTEAKERK